jgi:hypothetical protein
MFKRIKHIALVSIAIIYILQICFFFSGTLIEKIQEVRYENQIANNRTTESKEFLLSDWQLLDNKKEIKINTIFYDVVSAKKVGHRVIVKVVKDSFENEFRVTFQNVFNKKNILNSRKKKSSKPYGYLTVISNETKTHSTVLLHYFFRPNFPFLNIRTNKIVEAIYRPPC